MPTARIPRLSATKLAGVALAAVLLLSACFDGSEQQQGIDAMNKDRAAHGVPGAIRHDMLQRKAQAWAEHLAGQNSLSHSKLSDGISGCWRSLGENVGFGPSIGHIQQAYMKSPAHKANILNGKFNYAAVGVAHRGDMVFTVQVFMQGC